MNAPESPAHRVTLEGAALWRDGTQAVLSLKIEGIWHRILATDCEGIFHEERDAAWLQCKVSEALDAAELYRRVRRGRRDPPELREAAE